MGTFVPYSVNMKNFRWLTILMFTAILGIAIFLVYWLYQNYSREKSAMQLRTNAAFRETVVDLQTSKLNLENFSPKSGKSGPEVKVVMARRGDSMKVRMGSPHDVFSTINIIRNKVTDSLKKNGSKRMVISMDETTFSSQRDTDHFTKAINPPQAGIIRLLMDVDSLQDSLRVSEVDSAYNKRLIKEKIAIPFTIHKIDSCDEFFEPNPNQVIVGFSKPAVFELQPGNSFPYLIKRISLPLLFSFLLLGLTVLSFVLLYRNILKQRKLAEQKNEFISNITHELKTPIATVGVAIEALKNFNAIDNPAKTKEYLDISQNELQRLSMLVDKVLKLSMFEKKEMELKKEPVDLLAVVNEVTESLKLQFEKHRATVTVNNSGDTIIQGDKLHLLSVVFNLLDNALKYGNENPVIKIDIRSSEKEVVLSVSDNGIGIPAEYRTKVFEKFFRIPHGDTHNAKGYGLGLSYVAQVVEKHNGTIEVRDNNGGGASFIITFPKNSVA
jgi:two-component system, OmpR family, phosphate regulon sensor histidine kinase PhoR